MIYTTTPIPTVGSLDGLILLTSTLLTRKLNVHGPPVTHQPDLLTKMGDGVTQDRPVRYRRADTRSRRTYVHHPSNPGDLAGHVHSSSGGKKERKKRGEKKRKEKKGWQHDIQMRLKSPTSTYSKGEYYVKPLNLD